MQTATITRKAVLRDRARRLRAWLRPPRQLRTTSLGKIVIVFSIVIGVAATNTGNNLLYLVLGGLFGIIAASGVLSERVLRGVRVDVASAPVGTAGEPLPVPVTLRADPDRDSFLLEVSLLDTEGNTVGQVSVRELLRGRCRSIVVPVTRAQRGPLAIAQVRVATRFPFQMYEKARLYPVEQTLWFAPAPLDGTRGDHGRNRWHGAEADRTGRGDGEDFRGLRQRLPTDPLSRVHWKRSVAAGEQVVKIFAGARVQTVTIRLGRGPDETRFETGLREVAGLLVRLQHEGRPIRLLAGDLHAVGGPQHPSGLAECRRLLAQVERARLADGPVWRLDAGTSA